jgi:transposase-like protein
MARKAKGRGDAERRRILTELEASGQSVASFARQRGLSAWTLYDWRRRLGSSERPEAAPEPGFVQVVVKPERQVAAPIQVELPTGARIHVPPGFDEAELRRLVEVLFSC